MHLVPLGNLTDHLPPRLRTGAAVVSAGAALEGTLENAMKYQTLVAHVVAAAGAADRVRHT